MGPCSLRRLLGSGRRIWARKSGKTVMRLVQLLFRRVVALSVMLRALLTRGARGGGVERGEGDVPYTLCTPYTPHRDHQYHTETTTINTITTMPCPPLVHSRTLGVVYGKAAPRTLCTVRS